MGRAAVKNSQCVRARTVVEVLRERGQTQAQREAFRFLRYRAGAHPDQQVLTYGELAHAAQSIAGALQARCQPGDRALILTPPGLEYVAAFLGCAQAGIIAVPAYPPRNARHVGRLSAIVKDCGACALLMVEDLRARLTQWSEGALPEGIAVDALPEDAAAAWRDTGVGPQDLAFLQYTSGTTGTPKGVMVTHANLMANHNAWQRGALCTQDVLVSWLPPYHDLGLIGSILQPLLGGFRHVSMAPAAFLQEPARWLRALSEHRATLSMAPNFAYELCAALPPTVDEGLDLSALRYVIYGGEPVRAQTLERFAARFAGCGLRAESFAPGYGLAECTLQASMSWPARHPRVIQAPRLSGCAIGADVRAQDRAADDEQALQFVSNGPVIDEHELCIVEPHTRQMLPAGHVGEIWVSGPTVARGYWGREAESQSVFAAQLRDDCARGAFLRTGDLGTLIDGELYVMGRIKELIIVRGRNHYAQDIEATVAQSHPTLEFDNTIAFGIQFDQEERLVIIYGLSRSMMHGLDSDALLMAIRRAIIETHEIDPHAIVLVRPASLPRTSSGKLQRLAARDLYLKEELSVVASWQVSAADAQIVTGLRQLLADTAPSRRAERLRRELAQRMAHAIGLSAPLDEQAGFSAMGLDSLRAVQMSAVLNHELQLEPALSATVMFDRPNLLSLCELLEQRLGWKGEPQAWEGAGEVRGAAGVCEPIACEPIAIVGLSARVPGASDAQQYWQLLHGGVDATREISADRFDVDEWYDEDRERAGKIYVRRAGLIEQIDRFDAAFFGISPREAVSMDPQQRLLLEGVWQALEDAGIAASDLRGTVSGVYMGVGASEYGWLLAQAPREQIDAYFGTGTSASVIAGRISYSLGLQGPALSIDTACSSSLVAVHQACQALRARECELALAGGVSLIVSVQGMLATCRARMLSADGRSKSFDAAADGYGRGEGYGVVVLKRLSDAQRAGDRILAVIRGSAVNQDGASGGLTVPNGPAQERVIAAALKQAGVEGKDISYLEAHGTGTALGDPIEVQAAAAALGQAREQPLLLGSVKANIGHLEAAAGIAGLIKVVLSLQAGQIPAQVHFHTPNPHIPWEQLAVQVVRAAQPWPTRRRVAGVSSFGFSGTNAHVVLEGYEAQESASTQPQPQPLAVPVLYVSAKSEAAVKTLAARYESYLQQHPTLKLWDLCQSAALGRTHFTHRAGLIAPSVQQLSEALRALRSGQEHALLQCGQVKGAARIGVLFSGQGTQYAQMGRGLYESEPVCREVMDRCARELAQLGLHEHDLLQVMFAAAGTPEAQWLDQTLYAQPALYALQCALWQYWQGMGIEPAALLGHSVGEYAAAYAAGVFTLEEGVRLVGQRAALMGALPEGGGMLVLHTPLQEAEQLLQACGECAQRLSVAVDNGVHCVISGALDDLQHLSEQAHKADVRVQALQVSHAFHSYLLEPMLERFEQAAAQIAYRPAQRVLISNLTGEAWEPQRAPDASYWRRHAREAVRFAAGVRTLANMGVQLLLEIGPKALLAPLAHACWPSESTSPRPILLSTLSARQTDQHGLAAGLSQLYAHGATLNLHARSVHAPYQRVPLPAYPLEPQRFWIDSALSARAQPATWEHAALGIEHRAASGEITYTQQLREHSPSWLADHQVFGTIVLPGAAHGCLLATAMAGPCRILDMQFRAAVALSSGTARELQLALSAADESGVRRFGLYGRLACEAAHEPAAWQLHSQGRVEMLNTPVSDARAESSIEILRSSLAALDIEHFYERLQRCGVSWGPRWRGVQVLRSGAGVSYGEFIAPHAQDTADWRLAPQVLDACFGIAGAALWGESEPEDALLPFGWEALEIWRAAPQRVLCQARVREYRGEQTATVDLWLYDGEAVLFARVRGLMFKRATRAALLGALSGSEWLYEQQWVEPVAVAASAPTGTRSGTWLLLGEATRREGLRAALLASGAVVMSGEGRDLRALLGEALTSAQANGAALQAIVWLAGDPPAMSDPANSDADRVQEPMACAGRALAPAIELLQALSERELRLEHGVSLITESAVACDTSEPMDAAGAALWGFARAAHSEQPQLRLRLIDATGTSHAALAAALLDNSQEWQLALRSGVTRVPRLRRVRPNPGASAPLHGAVRLEPGRERTLQSVRLVPVTLPPPAEHEVQLQIQAVGLNFRDVLNALGLYPGDAGALGVECAGEVIAVGSAVTEFRSGDRVFGFAPGCMATQINAPAALLRHLPAGLTAAAAAGLPTVFCTAMAAFDAARLKAGDRVLIHAGAGGVGVAAIQLARMLGAEVFATASAGKQAFVRSLGVRYVYDSRNTDFAQQIARDTDGLGVDVVLNSLTSSGFIQASLTALSGRGHFIEISKRNIWSQAQMQAARPDVHYQIFALDDRLREAPAQVGALLDRLVQAQAAGHIAGLPHRCLPLQQAGLAMQQMQRAAHVGKLVLSCSSFAIRRDGAYLISGGLGALGLAACEWLAAQGAGQIVLLSRRVPSSDQQQRLATLAARCVCRVQVECADVSDRDQLQRVIDAMALRGERLRGVIHAAGVLDDGVLAAQSWQRCATVLRPKLQGAWNLHRCSVSLALDFFVLYSSVAAVLGSAAQSSYAAANAALDAIAQQRRVMGLPATSIAWGPWAIGMASAARACRQLAQQGLRALPSAAAHSVLEQILQLQLSHPVVLDADWKHIAQGAEVTRATLLAELLPSAQTVREAGVLQQLQPLAPEQQRQRLSEWLGERLRRILRLGVVPEHKVPFDELGLDSLMALELRNQLNGELQLQPPLPATVLFEQRDLHTLQQLIERRLGIDASGGSSAPTHAPHLLPIRREGTQLPLFCIPGLAGHGAEFFALADALPNEIPVWSLRPHSAGTPSCASAAVSESELLDRYEHAIRSVQPHGPYRLAGHSLGGIYAHALALRLEAAGERVSLLAMLDSMVPAYLTKALAVNIGPDLQQEAQTGALQLSSLEGVLRDAFPASLRDTVVAQLSGLSWRSRSVEPLARCQTGIVLFRAMRSYQAEDGAAVAEDAEAFAWSQFTASQVSEYVVPASHFQMLHRDHVMSIAHGLKEHLA
jgi:phthiocerol/phenolphthiocerol synthesis type-I polyketide synthase C